MIELTENQKQFIGYTFINRKGYTIEVVGVDENRRSNYLCTCSFCNLDQELFPNKFSVTKSQITHMGQVPCGCSKTPKYTERQWEVLVKRECNSRNSNIVFNGWYGEFKFAKTKLLLTNIDNGYEWTPTINKFYNRKSEDPLTAIISRSVKRRRPLEDIKQEIVKILSNEGGEFISFDENHENIFNRFKWKCDKGHYCETSISNFLHLGRRCRECNKGGYVNEKGGSLYIVRWYNEEVSYLKIGITNSDIKTRVSSQQSRTTLDYTIVRDFYHPDGRVISKCEKYVKNTLKCNICPRELLPDGFTETMEDNKYNLNYMINYLSFYLF